MKNETNADKIILVHPPINYFPNNVTKINNHTIKHHRFNSLRLQPAPADRLYHPLSALKTSRPTPSSSQTLSKLDWITRSDSKTRPKY